MGEAELAIIEKRADQYSAQAKLDILQLTAELRRLWSESGGKRAHAASPLYDALTGLLNAGAYGVRFAMARARSTRYRKIFAVMAIDLNFAAGAQVPLEERERTIKAVAERLESCVRATDTLARIGEDNFAVILEDLAHAEHGERVRETVQAALAEPMRVGDRDIVPATSVELLLYPTPNADAPGVPKH